MTGTYKTLDSCEYRLWYEKVGKPAKMQLMAQCVKSTVREGEQQAFIASEENIERNLRHNLWIKI